MTTQRPPAAPFVPDKNLFPLSDRIRYILERPDLQTTVKAALHLCAWLKDSHHSAARELHDTLRRLIGDKCSAFVSAEMGHSLDDSMEEREAYTLEQIRESLQMLVSLYGIAEAPTADFE